MRAVLQRLLPMGAMALALIWTLSGALAADKQIVVEPDVALHGVRVAFVVGIDHYARGAGPIFAPDLRNPINDAQAMRDMLSKLGFTVIYGEDLSKEDFDAALDRFEDRVANADIAVVYFSGHGASFEDLPYLVPSDATFDELRQTERKLIKVEDVLRRLREAKGVRIALFDACRDNDAEQALKQRVAGTKGVSQSRGLASTASPQGLIVMYAAQHLQTAKDGSDAHSPFAAALLDKLPTPNVNITTALEDVARSVIEKTGGAQKPELVVDLFDKFTLIDNDEHAAQPPTADANKPSPPATGGPDPRLTEAALVWQTLQNSTDAAALTAYSQRFAGTFFETMAKQRLAGLEAARPPEPVRTSPPAVRLKCGGNSDQAVAAPVLAIFAALRAKDINLYAQQWSEAATSRDGRSGQAQSRDQLISNKQRSFARWGQVDAQIVGPTILSKTDSEAWLEDTYTLTIQSGGRIIHDSAQERYHVRCEPSDRWQILENLDYMR